MEPAQVLDDVGDRTRAWAATMEGHAGTAPGTRQAHAGRPEPVGPFHLLDRADREADEDAVLAPGATRAVGAGDRARPEDPDPWRTCFERDRDRILHSPPFRRMAGKTQVFIFPDDHQRTRLTHALEVAQVATAIARACRLNVALTEAIALGHDCGHGPGGHASEEALAPFLPEGFDHAVWGADVTLAPLNLCQEVLDGVRNHSWSRPCPATPEGQVVSVADRVAYCAHDLEDAVRARIVSEDELPRAMTDRCGHTRSEQLAFLIGDVVHTTWRTGTVTMSEEGAQALAALRRFNYERIYLRPASISQAESVVHLLRALVEAYGAAPELLPGPDGDRAGSDQAIRRAVGYVAGMTDRFACQQATHLLGWSPGRLPRGLDLSSAVA